jgi:hypothetical protein
MLIYELHARKPSEVGTFDSVLPALQRLNDVTLQRASP